MNTQLKEPSTPPTPCEAEWVSKDLVMDCRMFTDNLALMRAVLSLLEQTPRDHRPRAVVIENAHVFDTDPCSALAQVFDAHGLSMRSDQG